MFKHKEDCITKNSARRERNAVIRKIAHFAIYTSLGIFSFAFISTFKIKEKMQVIITTLWGIIYASSDEIHQMFSFGRHASVDDVIIDTLGVIFRNIIGYAYKKDL